MKTVYLIRGADKIAEAIGRPAREIPALVKKSGLPAFQIGGIGPWHAVPTDLEIWAFNEADKYLPSEWGEMRAKYQHLFSLSNQGGGGI